MNMYTGTRDPETEAAKIEVKHTPSGHTSRIVCEQSLDWSSKDGSQRIARAILTLEFGEKTAMLCSNDFRSEIIARQPYDRFILTGHDVREWYEDYLKRGQEYEEWLLLCAAEAKAALSEVRNAA